MSAVTSLTAARSNRPGTSTDPRTKSLESRLEDGYGRIEQAHARGEDVTAWEEFWIELLHEYEASALELQEAA
jgi:hypothetical protein